jgi:hypothetical protein
VSTTPFRRTRVGGSAARATSDIAQTTAEQTMMVLSVVPPDPVSQQTYWSLHPSTTRSAPA